MDVPNRSTRLVAMGVLAIAYVAAGRVGLTLDAVGGFATLVWAPTGLSLAALTFFGAGLWPGVAAAAFAVNLWNGAAAPVAAGIAFGNTMEAVAGALILRRMVPPALPLWRPGDVISFVVLAAGLATTISATVGVSSLFLGGTLAAQDLARTWAAWWLGDSVGALVVAPFLLAWAPGELTEVRGGRVELLVLTTTVAGASALIFSSELEAPSEAMFLAPYLLLGPLLWAALRFETRGAAWAIFLATAVAVVGTTLGRGPLRGDALFERLWVLQASIGIMATTFLVLGAVAAARSDAERALRVAKEAAESSSTAKSRFLAVMSHELRTPLNGIIGYASLLESGLRSDAPPDHRRYLARIRAAAEHLTSVIEGVLTFSRAESGQEELDLKSFDAAELVRESVALLEPEADRKGLVLLPRVDSRIELRSDPGKLRQILLNLVGNAVKFSSRGEILVEAVQEGETVIFRVRDQGPGIPAERLDAIFEPFNRAPADGLTVPGTGLGLSVCSTLAQLMHGELSVESRTGEGSAFTLRIPVDPPGVGQARSRDASARSPRSTGEAIGERFLAEP